MPAVRLPARPPDLAAALALLHRAAFADAAAIAAAALAADPRDPRAAMLLGLAEAGMGRIAPAADLLLRACALAPDAGHPVTEALAMLETFHATDTLRALLDAMVARAPQDHRLLTAAGAFSQQTGDTARAQAWLARARALAPTYHPAIVAEAAALADTGDLDRGIAILRDLIAGGGADAACWSNLGLMFTQRNRFAEADAAFREARARDPTHAIIQFNHGMALLKSGRLAQGWSAFNKRLELPGHSLLPAATLLPRLAPTDRLDGATVLITHDSGYGDTLQFIRYAPLLAARGARVLLWVPPPLCRLMERTDGIAAVFTDRTIWPLHDWHCPVMRLPDSFATSLADIPATIPYLHPDPADRARFAAWLGTTDRRPRVGLCFAGSVRAEQPRLQPVDRRRSMDPELFRPLLARTPHVRWISLQLERPHRLKLEDPIPLIRDFADTAALVAELDLVVAVDTAVAHLAAALGRPVLLLDRYDNCWRWLHGRPDSPWYPDLRILRQASWGDWQVPLRLLQATLAEAFPASP